MTNTFAVGEVAKLVPLEGANCSGEVPDHYFGTLVIIDSTPIRSWVYVGDIGYFVVAHDGQRFDVGVVCLQKRRPPQDWVRICRLTERPVEELA